MSTIYGIVWSTGVAQAVWPDGFSLARLVSGVVLGIVTSSALVLCEEIGFRGYLLPRLMQLGTIRALLLSSQLHAVWHLPLMVLTPFIAAGPDGRRVTPQTPFQIASLGKPMTGVAIMQLVEAGKLDLDAPIQRYLPWFRVADETASGQITVRHLLNQTTPWPQAYHS
jgi:hypothetical protein